MTDTSTLWDEAVREAHMQAIATERVVALRSDFSYPAPLTPAQRKTIARQSLERAAMQLEVLGDDIADAELLEFLDAFDARLSRRRIALRMHLRLVSLVGIMGRAP